MNASALVEFWKVVLVESMKQGKPAGVAILEATDAIKACIELPNLWMKDQVKL